MAACRSLADALNWTLLVDFDLGGGSTSITDQRQRRGAADPRLGERAQEALGAIECDAVDRGDHVADPQAGGVSARTNVDADDQHALGVGSAELLRELRCHLL